MTLSRHGGEAETSMNANAVYSFELETMHSGPALSRVERPIAALYRCSQGDFKDEFTEDPPLQAIRSRFPCIRSTEQARQPRPPAYYFAAPVRYYWLHIESGTLEQKLPCLGKISADHLTSSRRQQGRTMPTSPFGKAYVSTLAAPLLADPRSSRSLHAFLVQHCPQVRYESSDLRTSS